MERDARLFLSFSLPFLPSLALPTVGSRERGGDLGNEGEGERLPSIVWWWGQVATEVRRGEWDHRKSVCPYLRDRVNHTEVWAFVSASTLFDGFSLRWLHAVETSIDRAFRQKLFRQKSSLDRVVGIVERIWYIDESYIRTFSRGCEFFEKIVGRPEGGRKRRVKRVGEIPTPSWRVRRAGYTISQKGEKILVVKRWEVCSSIAEERLSLGTGASLYYAGLSKTFSDIDDDTADYFYCVLKITRNNFWFFFSFFFFFLSSKIRNEITLSLLPWNFHKDKIMKSRNSLLGLNWRIVEKKEALDET